MRDIDRENENTLDVNNKLPVKKNEPIMQQKPRAVVINLGAMTPRVTNQRFTIYYEVAVKSLYGWQSQHEVLY